jgi:hypothetical protein
VSGLPLQAIDSRYFNYKVSGINGLRVMRSFDFLFTPEEYRISGMGFVKRRETFRLGLPTGSDRDCSIVGFKGKGFGHALVDLVSGPEEG